MLISFRINPIYNKKMSCLKCFFAPSSFGLHLICCTTIKACPALGPTILSLPENLVSSNWQLEFVCMDYLITEMNVFMIKCACLKEARVPK